MEKRVLLAVVLSFVVLYGYQAMFPPPKPPQRRRRRPDPGAPQLRNGHPPPAQSSRRRRRRSRGAGAVAAAAAAPVVADTAEREIVVENDSVRAVFTTRGGVLKSWRLKKYQDAAKAAARTRSAGRAGRTLRVPSRLSVDDAAMSTDAGAGTVSSERDSARRAQRAGDAHVRVRRTRLV